MPEGTGNVPCTPYSPEPTMETNPLRLQSEMPRLLAQNVLAVVPNARFVKAQLDATAPQKHADLRHSVQQLFATAFNPLAIDRRPELRSKRQRREPGGALWRRGQHPHSPQISPPKNHKNNREKCPPSAGDKAAKTRLKRAESEARLSERVDRSGAPPGDVPGQQKGGAGGGEGCEDRGC